MTGPGAGFRNFPPRLWIAAIALTLSLGVGAAGIPERFGATIEASSRIRGSGTWTRGSHALLGRDLHEVLVAADTLLPRHAVVLLVTPGRDILRSEYIAFHRALYLLAPRQVLWAAPTARDGSWESNWWTEIGPDSNASMRHAREAGASHILSLDDTGSALFVALDSADAVRPTETEWRAAPSPLRALVALAVIVLAGWAVYTILSRGHATSVAETAAMSWLFGCAAISLAMFWMIRLDVTPNVQRIAVGLVTLLLSLLVIRWRGPLRTGLGSPPGDENSGRLVGMLNAGLGIWLLAEIAGLFLRSAAGPLAGWDGWVTWAMKARVLHLQHDSDALLMDASREISNRSYPLLLPLTESWIFGWVGAADDRFAAIVTLSFLVALLVLLLSTLRSRVRLAFALAIAIAFVTTPYAGLLASLGYADIMLAAYALAAVISLRKWMESPDASVWLAATLVGILPWVKHEGFILFVALLIGACATVNGAWPRRRLVGSAAISMAVCAAPWYLLVATADIPQSAFSEVPLVTAQRAREILVGLASRAIALEWHGIWLTSIAALAMITVSRRWRTLLPVAITAYVTLLAVSFFFSSYHPLAQHVLRSGDRLLLHVAPLALLMIVDVMTSHRRASSATAKPHAGPRSG